MTSEQITAAIGALEVALASGELTIEYSGRRVTYRSTTELVAALDYFRRAQLGVPASGPAPASADRGTYAAFERD
ncbi:hypothetical protein A1351_15475 [Methylosinus sp. R-45379]|uniref:phage head-tail joining protein n=1 Tax=Methylosinus sp. R-45379 TaxID=980563 RepID=UPI0007C8D9F8|nr:hypothetical protein A1351_15475 [Methylosinus sp. R-45379]